MIIEGWAWNASWAGGGVPPCIVRVVVDGATVSDTIVANITRHNLVNITGAPNSEHGFLFTLDGKFYKELAGKGKHFLKIQAGETPQNPKQWSNFGDPESTHSPIEYQDGKLQA